MADEKNLIGFKAADVILSLVAEFVGGFTDITKDTDERAITANILFGDDSTAKSNAIYGVSGVNCFNLYHSSAHASRTRNLTITSQDNQKYVMIQGTTWWSLAKSNHIFS